MNGMYGSPAQRKMLVVDDEPKICQMFAHHFALHGFEVREVQRGEEALALTSVFHPDVVLLDLLMPGIGGIETLKQLQQLTPRPKIIILSAADHDDVVKGALQFGADFYMTKPVNFTELDHVVNGFSLTARKTYSET